MTSPWVREVALGLERFYAKLTEAPYLSPDDIEHPPSGGWSDAQLDVDGLRTTLGRSDAVVDLLRHIPYVRAVEAGPQSGQWPIFPKTKAIRYLRDSSSIISRDELQGWYELVHLPPDIISLTHPAGEYTLYGPQWWLVDCKTGRITRYAGPPRGEALAEEFESEWKKAPSYAPDDFFEEMTRMVGKDYYPVPGLVPSVEADFCTLDRREWSSIYQTYMLAGWQHGQGPGPNFDREKCRKDLKTLLLNTEERESKRQKVEAARRESRLHPRRKTDPATYPDGYDRDVIVKGLTRFYEKLAQMAYFPASLIQYPPGGRWSDEAFLPADKLRLLGFNNRVVDLLRHMPYIDVDETHEDNLWPVTGRSEPLRYLQDNPGLNDDLNESTASPEDLYAGGLFPFPEKMPDGMVPIAGVGSEYVDGGEWWIVDTNAGTVIVYDANYKQVEDAPDDKPWLWTPPRPAGPFFDGLVDALYNLDLVPLPRPDTELPEYYPEIWGEIREDGEEDNDRELQDLEAEEAREIYRMHGWPDLAKFRRQECYDALVKLRTRLLEEE